MGRTTDACAGQPAYRSLNYRTVEEIQRNFVKQGKRNGFSRLFGSRKDKEVITAWRQDLAGILHIFNVRSAGFIWHTLMAPFQTELVINTHVMVAEIRRNGLTGQGGTHPQHHPVSVIPIHC